MSLLTRAVFLVALVCASHALCELASLDAVRAPLTGVCYRLGEQGAVPRWQTTLSTRYPRTAFPDVIVARDAAIASTDTSLHSCVVQSVQQLADDNAGWQDVSPQATALFSTDGTRTLFFGPVSALNYATARMLDARVLRVQFACKGYYEPVMLSTRAHTLLSMEFVDEQAGHTPVIERVSEVSMASVVATRAFGGLHDQRIAVECVSALFARSQCATLHAPSASVSATAPLFTQYFARIVLSSSQQHTSDAVALHFHFAAASGTQNSEACDAVLMNSATGEVLTTYRQQHTLDVQPVAHARGVGAQVMQAVMSQVVRVIDLRWLNADAEATIVLLRDGTLAIRHALVRYNNAVYDTVSLSQSVLRSVGATHGLACTMPSVSATASASVSASSAPRCHIDAPRMASVKAHTPTAAFFTELTVERRVCNGIAEVTLSAACEYASFERASDEHDWRFAQCDTCELVADAPTLLVCGGQLTLEVTLNEQLAIRARALGGVFQGASIDVTAEQSLQHCNDKCE
jgi:hypothetical protein